MASQAGSSRLGDASALADAIARMASDPVHASALGAAARTSVVGYTVPAMVTGFSKILLDELRAPRTHGCRPSPRDGCCRPDKRQVVAGRDRSHLDGSPKRVAGGPREGCVRNPIDGNATSEPLEVSSQISEPPSPAVVVPEDDAVGHDHPSHLLGIVPHIGQRVRPVDESQIDAVGEW